MRNPTWNMLIILYLCVAKDRSDFILQHNSAHCRLQYKENKVRLWRRAETERDNISDGTTAVCCIFCCGNRNMLAAVLWKHHSLCFFPFLTMPFLVLWRFGSDAVMSSITLKQKQTLYIIKTATSSIFFVNKLLKVKWGQNFPRAVRVHPHRNFV